MSVEDALACICAEIKPVDEDAAATARARHDQLLKPPGSLGRLEELGAWLAAVAGKCPPPLPERPAVLVCAGDHGVVSRGISAWPSEVTAVMVGEFCADRAAVNALARTAGASVSVLDVGVGVELPAHPLLKRSKVRAGAADLAAGPAMSREEAARAVVCGVDLAEQLVANGADMLIGGDMGIGNTTPAACLIAAFTGHPAEEVTGPGAGGDAAAVAHKAEVVRAALALHAPDSADGLGTLAAVGGLEHAAIAGFILGAAREQVPLILDGVSTVAAALVARALSPAALGYAVAGHRSTEPGASAALEALGLDPLLELGMRLGEATGGVLAAPIVRAAAAALTEMATFEEAGITA
ncbi:MAG TPA: nicotinate-nucleotide--dimethylbenzimidazole phosphoribosyltransferase [Thermoleophilaceae bacterium]|nr:nicotinate-nucleotide--dimethylbenzimidazole phosphoribosyltransferase [Thermoleophilaceae bacterium]